MANRGMLPKFRPATVGGREAPARPMIRPVKPVAPPPPPSPPRRSPSGIRHPAPHGPAIESEHEISTASFQDPPTMAAARQRIHEIARELPSQYDSLPRFDDETQARPVDGDLIMASRRRPELDVPYEALPSLEVARPYDEYEEQFSEHGPAATQLRRDHHDDSFSVAPVARRYVESGEQVRDQRISDAPAAKYNTLPYSGTGEDSGPRQRPRKDVGPVEFDAAAYEANYPGVRRDARREESYPRKESSYEAPRREESAPPVQPTRREGSYSNRSAARAANEQSWPAPAPQIPEAPAVPREMLPAGFVMGVQPLRAGSVAAPMPAAQVPEAFPPPQQGHHQPRVRTPMMGVPYGQQSQAGFAPAASPRAMQSGQHLQVRPTTNAPVYAQPVGHQLQMTDVEDAQQGSKVGRFAWFVFGAAFGIFFAFFATGFVPRLGKKEEIAFPPAAQIPQQPQAPVAAAPPAQPQAPQTATAAPVAQPPVVQPTVAQPAVVQPAVVQPPVVAVAAPPVVAAPPPVTAAPAPAPQAPQAVVAEAKPTTPQRPAPAAAPAPPPAPRGQRAAAIARRPSPPPSSGAPKALPGSGSVEADDDAPSSSRTASAPSSGGGGKSGKNNPDIGGISDLLSAGLGP